MKNILGFMFLALTFLSLTSQELKGYLTLFEDSNNAKYFKYGEASYLEFFANKKEEIQDHKYYVNFRKYSWGETDTSYYRKDDKYYYHFDKKNNQESIALPLNPTLGDQWMEIDSSWRYEVIAAEQNFETPKRKYQNCVKVLCQQMLDRDVAKENEYFLLYSPKYGYVGNTDANGNILSYLMEVKLNTKEGEGIGEK